MSDLPLLYQEYDIVCQEVPDEVTLAFNIADCPHRCPGCHSPGLRERSGKPLAEEFGPGGIVETYLPYITCVCFMGGESNLQEAARLARSLPCKTAIYVGCDRLEEEIAQAFDYVKTGEYRQDLGALDSPHTNQHMRKQNRETHTWEDITHRFRRNNHADR